MKHYYHPADLKKKLIAMIAICDSLPEDMLIYCAEEQADASKIMLANDDNSALSWTTRDYDSVIDMYRLSTKMGDVEIAKYTREDEQ